VGLNRHVTNLPGKPLFTPIEMILYDDAAADAGADREVDHIGEAFARSEAVLTHCGGVRVVLHDCEQPCCLRDAVAERKVLEPRQVGAFNDDARVGIQRARRSDADSRDEVARDISDRIVDEGHHAAYDMLRSALGFGFRLGAEENPPIRSAYSGSEMRASQIHSNRHTFHETLQTTG
jgi:hypothetical protein